MYVQKVADLKPGIELGFWEGWGAGAGREERTAWCGVGRVVLAVRPVELWRGAFMGWGSARGTKEEGRGCTQQH